MINSIGGNPPPKGGMMMDQTSQSLTDDQKDTVASILSDYDASSLTAEDAKSINAAFKDAGIKPGKDLLQAIQDAGFNGDTIRELDPPDEVQQGPPPPPPSNNGITGLDTESLSELQSILEKYDFSNLSSDDEATLLDELNSSGFLASGLNFDRLA